MKTRWSTAGFAAAALAIGSIPVPFALAFAGPTGLAQLAPGLELPGWVFGAVWAFIYPTLGVATSRIWIKRSTPGAPEALALFGVALLFFLAFLPITAAARDQRVTAMMDVFGLVCGYTVSWAYRRIDVRAARWMIPLLIWLPVTTALKIATL